MNILYLFRKRLKKSQAGVTPKTYQKRKIWRSWLGNTMVIRSEDEILHIENERKEGWVDQKRQPRFEKETGGMRLGSTVAAGWHLFQKLRFSHWDSSCPNPLALTICSLFPPLFSTHLLISLINSNQDSTSSFVIFPFSISLGTFQCIWSQYIWKYFF